MLKNDGSFTRIPDAPGQKPSVIDLTMCSTPIYFNLSVDTLFDPLGSDHLPIKIVYNKKPKVYHDDSEPKLDFSKANWDKFKDILNSNDYSTDYSNPEEWYKAFQKQIMTAASNSIPTFRKGCSKVKTRLLEWNDACQVSKVALRKATKRYSKEQNSETEKAKQQAKIDHNRNLAIAEKNYWTKFFNENVNSYKDTGIVYKKMNKLKGQYNPPNKPLNVNGRQVSDPQEKANILANTFASVSQNHSLPSFQNTFRRNKEKSFVMPDYGHSFDEYDKNFTLLELSKAILSIKNSKKATGADPLSYQLIKQFPLKTKNILLGFYNHIWQQGYVLDTWKEAQVIAIQKPGKPAKDASSFRPISLTPHISKLYERLVSTRLEYFLEKHDVIPICQTGFRRGRSCTENLMKLSSHVKRAMMKRRPVMAAFFDIKRAFDTVWHEGLLNKLYEFGVSKNMYYFFKSFLHNRTMRVKIGSKLSIAHTLEMGIPQGSIVAPTAFSIMLADIKLLNIKNATMSLYADDLALWSTSKYRRTVTDRFSKGEMNSFQRNVDLVSHYMTNNGFTLSPEKTVFMIFTNSCRVNKELFIKINNMPIYPSEEVKYLGVILDKGFTFEKHINNLISKTRKSLNLVKLLKKEKGVNNPANMKLVITSLIRSRLRYGEEIFFSANPSLIQKLQQCETSIIKKVFDIPNHANPILVYREIGLIPLTLNRHIQTTKTIFRLGTASNDLENELVVDFNDCNSPGKINRLKSHPKQFSRALSAMNYIEPIVHESEISNISLNIENEGRFFCRPWEETEMTINDSLSNYKKSDEPYLVASAAKEMLHEHKEYLKIFTDGSLQNEGAGCAFVIPEISYYERYKLEKGTSIFSAELFALEKALEFAYQSNHENIIILSDSKSVLQTLKTQKSTRVNYLLKLMHKMNKQGKLLKLQWVPSHLGIHGNELADRAAKAAVIDNDLPTTIIDLSPSEVYPKIKQAGKTIWLKEFRLQAENLAWCDPLTTVINHPVFVDKSKRDAFIRLRCKVTRFEVYDVQCVCTNATFCVAHIFQCDKLSPQLTNTKQKCLESGTQFCYQSVMSHHQTLGWQLALTLVEEILNSEAGHLV